jgi:DNA-binding beta-propeller fold protein YncE
VHELSSGTDFAGHRIEEVAGRGGMGVVYRARQLDLDRLVALKVIAPELLEDASTRERFLREARAAASIDHPNVIPVYSAGEHEGIAYLTMRYVAGDDVRSLLRRSGPLRPARAAHICAQAGSALDAIHAAGFVHRDVKPANVLLGPQDHVYVTDFGLAKSALSGGVQTKSGHWVGTLDYVAPEQIRGEPVDARADVYALGGVLHYMLTGRAPYVREGDEARLWAHLSDPPPRPSEHGAPEDFDAVVTRAMAKDAAERYPSTGDLGRAALAAAGGDRVSVPERVVARGSAAPGGDAPRAATAGPDEPTLSGTRRDPDAAAEPATRRQPVSTPAPASAPRRSRSVPVTVAGLLAAGAVAAGALLIPGGDEPPGPTATPSLSPTPTSSQAQPGKVKTIRGVGDRPNGVAIAGGRLWVTSFRSDKLRVIDRARDRVIRTVTIAEGANDIVADGNDVWIAATRAGSVIRLDARTGRVRARLNVTKPVAVALNDRSVWVGSRNPVSGQPDHVVRIDRRTGAEASRYPVALGVSAMTLTGTDLWIAHRRDERASRLALATGEISLLPRRVGPGRVMDIAAGGGYVWASTEDGVVARIEPRNEQVNTIAAGGRAGQLAVARGRVWVALVDEGEVTSIDIRSSRRSGGNVPVGLSPYGVAADEDSVFVTSRGDGTLTRIDY